MKPPARPRHGAAGVEIESKDIRNRSFSTSRPRTSNVHVDCPPNWQHIGTVVDDLLASLKAKST